MTSSPASIRSIRPADRTAVLSTVRAADLLPEDGVADVATELDALVEGNPGRGAWLIDATDADVAGVAFYVPEPMTDGTWNLLMLAVHPDHQGQGRGSALVRAVEQDLRARGARMLVIETSGVPDFASQRRFYERLGYRRQGWIEEFFEAGDAKVVYAKLLDTEQAGVGGASGVRVATTGNLAGLTQLAVACCAEVGFTTSPNTVANNLRALVTSEAARVTVVAEPTTEALIAFAVTTIGFGLENGLIAELEGLYVAPDHRRAGTGTMLIEDAARWARARDCAQLEVVVATNGRDVEHLHRYYAALAFTDDGRRLRSRNLT